MLMIYFVLFVFGLIFGSFVNALVWRVRKQIDKYGSPKRSTNNKYSILQGRSMCPNCKHELAAKDLIPVLSWLRLGRKCRYCKKSISWQYPLVELITGALFLLSYVYWPYELSTASWGVFCLWLVLLTGLIALAVFDARWQLLPNRILYPLTFIAGAITLLSTVFLGLNISFLGIISSLLITSGVFYLLYIFSAGRWIGGGDVKYGILAGLLLTDPFFAFMNIFIASMTGTVFIGLGMLFGKLSPRSKISFGPFLIFGTIIVFLFGISMADWYEINILLIN